MDERDSVKALVTENGDMIICVYNTISEILYTLIDERRETPDRPKTQCILETLESQKYVLTNITKLLTELTAVMGK